MVVLDPRASPAATIAGASSAGRRGAAVHSAPVQASQARAGRSLEGSLSSRTASGSVTRAATARSVGASPTSRLRSPRHVAAPASASVKGIHRASGTNERAMPLPQASSTSFVSG